MIDDPITAMELLAQIEKALPLPARAAAVLRNFPRYVSNKDTSNDERLLSPQAINDRTSNTHNTVIKTTPLLFIMIA